MKYHFVRFWIAKRIFKVLVQISVLVPFQPSWNLAVVVEIRLGVRVYSHSCVSRFWSDWESSFVLKENQLCMSSWCRFSHGSNWVADSRKVPVRSQRICRSIIPEDNNSITVLYNKSNYRHQVKVFIWCHGIKCLKIWSALPLFFKREKLVSFRSNIRSSLP